LHPLSLAKRVPIVLLIVVSAFYFYGLGLLPLVGPDEPRYAQVAREMLMRSDLITPTLGGHTWFEKPVLLYWLMIIGYKLFGVTEQAARLGVAAAGVLTVIAVYWIARRVERSNTNPELEQFGVWAGVVQAAMLGLIVFSRAASFDVLVTMTMTWAIAFFLALELKPDDRRRLAFLIGFYVFIGLSLLAKGLVGLLPIVVIGGYYLIRTEWPRRYILTSLIWGLPLAFAVAAIWYGPVIAKHGRLFIDEFIIQHHFARYLSNKYNHPQRVYFYVAILVPLTLPWTPFVVQALGGLHTKLRQSADSVDELRIFSFAWLVIPTLFFSFSGSKLPGYIIPVLPACALLGGERVTRFVSGSGKGERALQAIGILALVFAVGGLIYAKRSGMISMTCAMSSLAPVIIAAVFVLLKPRLRLAAVTATVVATIISLVIVLNCGVEKLAQRESVKQLIAAANARGYSNLPVCGLHLVERTMEFYASGRVIYDARGEPRKFEGAQEIVDDVVRSRGPVLVLVPIEYAGQLTNLKSVRTEVIGNNGVWAFVRVSLN
jgi:4-amino-4-deoxy-L-arabinose transferase-like glycosyltransferase